MKHLVILGRETDIGYAELGALYGNEVVDRPLENVATVQVDDIDFARIGSSKKVAQFITETEPNINDINDALEHFINHNARKIQPKRKKINYGVSLYGEGDHSLQEIEKTIEKALEKRDFNTRRVPNENGHLSTAQVFHNKLDMSGFEFIIASTNEKVLIGYTTDVQNIISYTKRDQERPARDAKVGMLPPKLAQTMVNLATGKTEKSLDTHVLDPFCGTGVVMQEALLMGFEAHGSDKDARIVNMSRQNMQWLQKRFNRIESHWSVETADATKHHWNFQPDFVVSELDLGPPLSHEPSDKQLETLINDSQELVRATLENLRDNTRKGVRLCLGVPAWFQNNSVTALPLVDDLRGLGYNRIRFDTINNELIYRREDQIVGRHLLVLERI